MYIAHTIQQHALVLFRGLTLPQTHLCLPNLLFACDYFQDAEKVDSQPLFQTENNTLLLTAAHIIISQQKKAFVFPSPSAEIKFFNLIPVKIWVSEGCVCVCIIIKWCSPWKVTFVKTPAFLLFNLFCKYSENDVFCLPWWLVSTVCIIAQRHFKPYKNAHMYKMNDASCMLYAGGVKYRASYWDFCRGSAHNNHMVYLKPLIYNYITIITIIITIISYIFY